MKDNNIAPELSAPQQQGNQFEHESQEQEQEIKVREDRAVIHTDVETVLTPQQICNRYKSLVQQLENLSKTVESFRNHISQVVEESDQELHDLHAIMENEPQEFTEDKDLSVEELTDRISVDTLSKYQDIKQMERKANQIEEKVEQGIEDAREMYPAANKLGTKQDLEVAESPEELEERFLD